MKANMAGIMKVIAWIYMALVLLGGIILAANAWEGGGLIFLASLIAASFGFFMLGFAQLVDDTRAIREKRDGTEVSTVEEFEAPTL